MSPLSTLILHRDLPCISVPLPCRSTKSVLACIYCKKAEKKQEESLHQSPQEVQWTTILADVMAVQMFHIKLSSTNVKRLSAHRISRSPALRRAYAIAYDNCTRDQRRKLGRELARQVRNLLKGSDREEYRIRMVKNGWKGGAVGRKKKLVGELNGGNGALVWTGRLRQRKFASYKYFHSS